MRTRGFSNRNDEGLLRPKFASISEECGRPVNVKTRNLVVEVAAKGALPQDISHVSASQSNEISFDDELKGGVLEIGAALGAGLPVRIYGNIAKIPAMKTAQHHPLVSIHDASVFTELARSVKEDSTKPGTPGGVA